MTGRCQVFLSKHLVTETNIFDGGVLVNEHGVIEKVFCRNEATKLIEGKENEIDVRFVLNIEAYYV